MRKIVSSKPNFFLNILCEQEVIAQYHEKYDAMDKILTATPEILNSVHLDLKNYGDGQQRECPFSSEQILRMAIVKQYENWSYRECIIRISESDFLRNFVRIGMGRIMSFGFLCGAINRITEETWNKVNSLLGDYAMEKGLICPEEIRMDSTVCETNIHYPTDNSLLWDCYRALSKQMRRAIELEPNFNIGNRFHESKIKKLHTYIATHAGRKNKSTKRKIKRSLKTMIERVRRLCLSARNFVANANRTASCSLSAYGIVNNLRDLITLAERVVDQSERIHLQGEKVPASQRIFSIFEEHTELFKRGKTQKPVEFGHLVSIAQTREKYITFYDIRERSLHDTKLKEIALSEHEERFGALPDKFTADKNYYVSMDEIAELEEQMSLCAIGKKGRRSQEEYDREHCEEFKDMQRFRAGVEGSISFLKRVLGLRRCLNKGFKHFACTIGRMVFCHNLLILSRS